MVAEAAKKSPELIQLLELHQQFATIAPYSSSQKGGAGGMIEKPQTKADAGCQTDTHILEANLVTDYEWNEWELRRKAIKLVSRNSLQFVCVIFAGVVCCSFVIFLSLPGPSIILPFGQRTSLFWLTFQQLIFETQKGFRSQNIFLKFF